MEANAGTGHDCTGTAGEMVSVRKGWGFAAKNKNTSDGRTIGPHGTKTQVSKHASTEDGPEGEVTVGREICAILKAWGFPLENQHLRRGGTRSSGKGKKKQVQFLAHSENLRAGEGSKVQEMSGPKGGGGPLGKAFHLFRGLLRGTV